MHHQLQFCQVPQGLLARNVTVVIVMKHFLTVTSDIFLKLIEQSLFVNYLTVQNIKSAKISSVRHFID